MREGVMDFKVYEGTTNYLGIASVALPEITQKMLTVSGAGLGGDYEIPTGKVDAMSMTIRFRSLTYQQQQLTYMRKHTIELRAAHLYDDPTYKNVSANLIKYVAVIMPKKITMGEISPASPQPVEGEFAVHKIEMYYGNELWLKVDPANNIYWDRYNGNFLDRYNKLLGG